MTHVNPAEPPRLKSLSSSNWRSGPGKRVDRREEEDDHPTAGNWLVTMGTVTTLFVGYTIDKQVN